MAESIRDITRSHENYLRHLLLLGQAVPVALKALITRKVKKRGKNLAILLDENKETFENSHKVDSLPLFETGQVNTNIDSWDSHLLCVVTQVLFKSDLTKAELELIACISDQWNDLDNYAHDASIPYETFKEKWDRLHSAMLEVIKDIPESQYKCKQMIYSFKSEPIKVNIELITKLSQTTDVKMHVQMAIQEKVSPQIHGEREDTSDEYHQKQLQHDDPVFIEKLQDTFVYSGEPTVLTCELNVSDVSVKWQKDNKMAEESDTLKFLSSDKKHWLAISRAKLTDSATYICIHGTSSTKASLKVSDKPSKIYEALHVTSADIVENMDIVLRCQVNVHTDKAVWRHNGEEIKQWYRYHVSVQELEHKLTIQNVQFEDEGEYTVVFGDIPTSTTLTVQGNIKRLYDKQLIGDLYKNWIRAALGLKFLKLGLESFVDIAVRKHHSDLLAQLATTGSICTNCTMESLLPSHNSKGCSRKKLNCPCWNKNRKRKHCPFCSRFYDKICGYHETFNPVFDNTDVKDWGLSPWSVATCYISTKGYKGKTSAKEVDCSGLLSLFINNTFIRQSLDGSELDIFEKARDARNDIFHKASYELTSKQFEEYIDLFKGVFEIKDAKGNKALSGKPGVHEAIQCLDQLRKKQIDIRTAEDFKKHIKELQEHAMTDLAEKLDEAKLQSHTKLQQLEKRLKDTENELQLMRDLRSSQKSKENKGSDVPFEMELQIQVVGKTEKATKEGNRRIYNKMEDYRNNQNSETATCDPTEQSVHRIFGYITSIVHCKLVDVLEGSASVIIQVQCLTSKAIEEVLKVINGNEFQKETSVLRACLHAIDVLASCSSERLENTRKHLNRWGQRCDFTCQKHETTQCTWYCSDHDKFCCLKCKDADHRACVGLKQVVSDRSYGQQKQSLVLKSKRGKNNVKIKNRLINRGDNDEDDCDIASICVLPDGSILVLDLNNRRLKKLDSSYNLVSYCNLTYFPTALCYIGNDTAVISLGYVIQYANVSGSMKLLEGVKVGHEFIGLACHGDTLYVADWTTVYTYNKGCQQGRVLYRLGDLGGLYLCIAVSDDGEIIYITGTGSCFITIDNKGNHLFTLKKDVLVSPADVCVADDGTVLISDVSGNVLQVDYRGEHILGQVLCQSDSLYRLTSLCYDRKRCRIIVVGDKNNYISVYDLQCPSDVTNVK